MDYIEPNSDLWLSINNYRNEIWKDIKGYEGLYQISNYGRVKSCNILMGTRILRVKISKQGYCLVSLCRNNKSVCYRLHRLVLMTFDKDKKNYMCCDDEINVNTDKLVVNHKDENKLNNNVENLEWCTSKYNARYGTRIDRIVSNVVLPINQYTLDGVFIKTWNSISEAARTNGFGTAHIVSCCKHKRKSAHGYMWEYYVGNVNNINKYNPKTHNQHTKGVIYHEMAL